jgi:hypothetical protein
MLPEQSRTMARSVTSPILPAGFAGLAQLLLLIGAEHEDRRRLLQLVDDLVVIDLEFDEREQLVEGDRGPVLLLGLSRSRRTQY